MRHISDTAIGLAALSICENLLAVLMDRNVISHEDVEELLGDASGLQHSIGNDESDVNEETAEIIQQVLDGLAARKG